MGGLLYQFCVAYLDGDEASDADVIAGCSPIFLVDGQEIPFTQALLRMLDKADDAVADAVLLKRSNALGQDSIHFQQLRAFTLANALLENLDQLTKGTGAKTFNVAVVGAGFAGLTAVLTLLAHGGETIRVTLFEHHDQVLPRFFGAYGRQVYPYHHLRIPGDVPTVVGEGLEAETSHACPVDGEDKHEMGGIEKILDWTPGAIEKVVESVRQKAELAILQHQAEGRLKVHLHTRVLDIGYSLGAPRIQPVDYWASANVDKETYGQGANGATSSSRQSDFHAIILAPGGQRDAVSLLGQSNAEYWSPVRIQNSALRLDRYEVAIIGAGNTAASEVYNYLLHRHKFMQVIEKVRSWRNEFTFLDKLFALDYSKPISLRKFERTLTQMQWQRLREGVGQRLVSQGYVRSDSLVGVSVLVRNTKAIFETMNPLNKFLVLLLGKLDFVDIRNVYDEAGIPADDKRSPAEIYRIAMRAGELTIHCGKKKIRSKRKIGWSHVSNCSGPLRTYQNAFGLARSFVLRKKVKQSFLFKVIRNGKSALDRMTTTDLLTKKQTILFAKRDGKPTAPKPAILRTAKSAAAAS